MPNTIAVHDKDNDMIQISHQVIETTATDTNIYTDNHRAFFFGDGSKIGIRPHQKIIVENGKRTVIKGEDIPHRKDPNFDGTLIYWKPKDKVYNALITITIQDIDPKEYKNINKPIVFQKTVQVSEANAIIPGKRMGQIYIGQHINEVEAELGPPSKNNKSGFPRAYQTNKYARNFLTYVITNEDQIVILAAIIRRGRLRTPAGHGIGSISDKKYSKDDIYGEFGRTKDIRYDFAGELHVYKQKGIAIQYKPGTGIGGIVNAIAVFNEAGFEKTITLEEEKPDMSKVTIVK